MNNYFSSPLHHLKPVPGGPEGAPLAVGSARVSPSIACSPGWAGARPQPRPRAPTCDPAHAAPQPPARLSGRVRAQAVADEVHVLGAIAQLGLRREGASGPRAPGGDAPALRERGLEQDPGWRLGRNDPRLQAAA